jgi:AraC-like DNA-binding protein
MTAGANQLTAHARSRDVRAPTTPVLQLRAWSDALERMGHDVGRLLSDVGLDRLDLEDPDGVVPCGVAGALLERAQRLRPEKNFWTRLGVETPVGAFKLLDYLILTADTVGDAYKQLVRYIRLVGAPLVVDLREGEDPIRVVYTLDPAAHPASAEYSVALANRFMREEAEGPVTFAYVAFVHEPDDAADIERLIGCPVRTRASWAGTAVTREVWQVPLKRRDRVLRGVLESQADTIALRLPATDTMAADVRRALASRLARGEIAIDLIARDLGVSSRTLQRRLSAAGLSYQELCEDVRRELAERHMENRSLAIGEVAYLAGYSEPAAFHRAFKRWTGVTPQAFRRQRRTAR